MIQPLTIQRMRLLEDLIANGPDDAWSQVLAWQAASRHSVEILDCRRPDGDATLLAAQVTTRSPMGAIAFHSGGILVDGGWLRFLGAGNERIGRGGSFRQFRERPDEPDAAKGCHSVARLDAVRARRFE